jgi:hypothetical protein
MDTESRRKRLEDDFAALSAMRAGSDVLSFEPMDVAGRYVVQFIGRGLGPLDVVGRPALIMRHEVEIRLPLAYPITPPDIRWLTPLLHPNVSLGGVVQLEELHLPWTPEMGLDVVVERLWDVARGSFFDLEKASNEAARPWYDAATPLALPLDDRPLRPGSARVSNIVRYSRTGDTWNWPVDSGILFIGEGNACESLPVPSRVAQPGDGDVLYIGPE